MMSLFVEDGEVVGLSGPKLVLLTQELVKLGDRRFHRDRVVDLKHDLAHGPGAEQPHLSGLERQEDDVVLIAAEAAAFGSQHADDAERHIADADDLSDGRSAIWKEVVSDGLSEHDDVVGRGVVLWSEKAPALTCQCWICW